MRLTSDRRLARLGAILWVVNPQTAVAVIWTSGRTEVMITLFILAGLWTYVVAREERRPVLLGHRGQNAVGALQRSQQIARVPSLDECE